MDVLCVGMYRAGSTWQYDVAAHLVERHRGGLRVGFVPGDVYALPAGDGWRALKSHDAHRAFAAALRSGRAVALYCYRDLRDVAFSLAHKFGGTFEEIVGRQGWLARCLDNDAFWVRQPRTLCQRYEEMMADPVAAVGEIAAHLDIDLGDGEAEVLAEAYSLAANRGRAEELARRLRAAGVDLDDPANAVRWDGETLLHWNHIRQGRIGGWRDEATPRQLKALARLCGDWLIERGYEADLAWAGGAERKPLSPLSPAGERGRG
jgi:hypothetical protein